jgi:hypothetical protein
MLRGALWPPKRSGVRSLENQAALMNVILSIPFFAVDLSSDDIGWSGT